MSQRCSHCPSMRGDFSEAINHESLIAYYQSAGATTTPRRRRERRSIAWCASTAGTEVARINAAATEVAATKCRWHRGSLVLRLVLRCVAAEVRRWAGLPRASCGGRSKPECEII